VLLRVADLRAGLRVEVLRPVVLRVVVGIVRSSESGMGSPCMHRSARRQPVGVCPTHPVPGVERRPARVEPDNACLTSPIGLP
jgi:hypothetical protein